MRNILRTGWSFQTVLSMVSELDAFVVYKSHLTFYSILCMVQTILNLSSPLHLQKISKFKCSRLESSTIIIILSISYREQILTSKFNIYYRTYTSLTRKRIPHHYIKWVTDFTRPTSIPCTVDMPSEQNEFAHPSWIDSH